MTVDNRGLTHQQIGQIRDELERVLRRLDRSLKAKGGPPTREIDQSAVGRLSRIEALQNQGLVESLHAREQQKFDEIVQALRRLEDGSYGRCSGCRDTIGIERLLIYPETRTCTACGGVN